MGWLKDSIVELIKSWFGWFISRSANVTDSAGAGETEDKLKSQLKKEGW